MADSIPNNSRIATASTKGLCFSRLELLVIVGIMTIVVIISLPLMNEARKRMRRGQCTDNLRQVYAGMELYARDNDGEIPTRLEKSGKKIWGNLLGSSGNPYGLGHLIKGSYVHDPRIFYCPSNSMCRFEEQCRFDTEGAESWMTYRYRNNNAAGHPARWADIYVPIRINDKERAIVADDPYLDWHRFAHKAGYNVLYLDGNVKWVDDSKNEIQGDLYKAWDLFDKNF